MHFYISGHLIYCIDASEINIWISMNLYNGLKNEL